MKKANNPIEVEAEEIKESLNSDGISQLEKSMLNQLQILSSPTCDMNKEKERTNALVAVGTVILNTHKMKIDAVRTRHNIMKSRILPTLPSEKTTKKIN